MTMDGAVVAPVRGTSRLYRVEGLAALHALREDRALGHRAVMSLLLDDVLPRERPRQAAGLLWHVSPAGNMVLRSAVEPESARNGVELFELEQREIATGDRISIEIEMDCSYAAGAHVPDELWSAGVRWSRGRVVEVPADRLGEWLDAKFGRAGLAEVSIEHCLRGHARVGLRSGYRRPTVAVAAQATVADSDQFGLALTEGLGRGKSYGLGLLRLV